MPVRFPALFLLAACFATGCILASCPERASAQAATSPADSAAIAKAMKASDQAVASALGKSHFHDPDRFELGAAMPEGYFDWLGTFGYRRLVASDPQFEHYLHTEATYGHKDYLTEGSISAVWYVRPKSLWHPEWKVRPVLEAGIGGNIVVQFAELAGLNDWSSHARFFVKSHLQAGMETDLSDRLGLGVRGRFTVPAHQPLDYAQFFLFLR